MSDVFIYTLADSRTPHIIRYVGQTGNTAKRLHGHTSNTKIRNHKTNWIKSVNTSGGEIILEVLEVATKDNWVSIEMYWIEQLRQWGYDLTNSTEGGEGVRFMLNRQSPLKGRKVSEATRQRLINMRLGKKLSAAVKDKIRKSLKGRKLSAERIEQLSKSNSGASNPFHGKKHTQKTLEVLKLKHPFRKEIEQYEMNGDFVRFFVSSHQIHELTGYNRSPIMNCCKSKSKQAYGFVWKFKE